jgi:hypothetical protein
MRIPLTSAGIENPTVKWLLDKFEALFLLLIPVFCSVTALKQF